MKKIITTSTLLAFTVSLFLSTSFNTQAHFGSKGPFGGSVSCGISYDTAVFIGTKNGGVYHSANSQLLTWTPRPVGLKSGRISALAHTGSYLFAGTADSGVFRFTGFVGSDRYWEKVNTGLTNLGVTSLCAIDSITLLAGTIGDGVFKTTDKGATWSVANTNMLHFDIHGFARAGNRIVQISDGGLWASDDKAATWFDFTDVFTDDVNATAVSYNATTDELLVFNADGLFLLASASTTMTPGYTAVMTGLPTGTMVRSISNNGTTWYLATDKGVYTSPTGSITWTSENSGITTMDVTTVVPFQTRLVAGTNKEGLFKTSNSPVSWATVNNGFNNLETYSMITQGATLVIAATEKGVFVSNDLAASYTRANNGLTDSLNITDLTLFNSVLLASTKNAGVFVSLDTGKTWTAVNLGLTNLFIKKIIPSSAYVYLFNSANEIFRVDPSNLFAGWSMIQSGLPGGAMPTSMTFYSGNILLGTLGDGTYTRQEASGTWTQVNAGLSNLKVTSVTTNGSKLFAGTDGSGVFVTDPSSINWATTSSTNTAISHTALIGLNGNKIQAMAYDTGFVFASYKGGLLATSNNGATWIAGGNQFNLPSFSDINKITFVTTRVFVTTENNGLYSNALSELPLAVGEISRRNTAIEIYPNPNNGTFSVGLDKLPGKILELSMHDVQGKQIETLDPVQRHFSLDYPSGIYFLKVATDKNVVFQKITIQ